MAERGFEPRYGYPYPRFPGEPQTLRHLSEGVALYRREAPFSGSRRVKMLRDQLWRRRQISAGRQKIIATTCSFPQAQASERLRLNMSRYRCAASPKTNHMSAVTINCAATACQLLTLEFFVIFRTENDRQERRCAQGFIFGCSIASSETSTRSPCR